MNEFKSDVWSDPEALAQPKQLRLPWRAPGISESLAQQLWVNASPLLNLLHERGMSMQAAADEAGLHVNKVKRMARPSTSMPPATEIAKVARALKVSEVSLTVSVQLWRALRPTRVERDTRRLTMKAVAARGPLQKWMDDAGRDQLWLEAKSGLARATITSFKNDPAHAPTVPTLVAIAEAIGIPPGALLDEWIEWSQRYGGLSEQERLEQVILDAQEEVLSEQG